MKLRVKKLILLAAIALLAGLNASCPAKQKPAVQLPQAKELPADDAKRLETIGTKVFRIKWGDKLVAASDRGFQVVTDRVTTLSYRPTGNAYFVRNAKATLSGNSGFQGSNEELIARGRAILAGLGIDDSEIAEPKILQQFTSAGFIDSATRQAKLETSKEDRRSLLVTRVIRGLPVWTSRLMLDLDPEGDIASFELSWPKIEPRVLEAAVDLQKIAGAGYRAAERPGAKVESVQVGILHSPAAAFVDDQVAAVRIIYAPTDPRLSVKPLVYLGVDGRPVAIPRQMETKAEAPTVRRTDKASQRNP